MWHDTDPFPIPDVDLGREAAADPGGAASVELAWAGIQPDAFERVLFDLLRAQPGWDNVTWYTHTQRRRSRP